MDQLPHRCTGLKDTSEGLSVGEPHTKWVKYSALNAKAHARDHMHIETHSITHTYTRMDALGNRVKGGKKA